MANRELRLTSQRMRSVLDTQDAFVSAEPAEPAGRQPGRCDEQRPGRDEVSPR
jgi:hypothetical protein